MTKYTLLKCGKVFDGINERYFENVELLVDGSKIIKFGTGIEIPEETTIVDLSDKVVTPGLMEIHNHATAYDNRNVATILNEVVTKNPLYRSMGTLVHLNELLVNGFTLVRDCGSIEREWELVDIRDAIAIGMVDGPTYVVCGHSGGIIGGHMDLRQYVSSEIVKDNVLKLPSIGAGAAFFREWVRKEFVHNVDFIKFHADGGFATPNDDPEDRHMTEEEISTIIETAHLCNLKATAHVYGDETARIVIKHGVDGMEHGALLAPETYDLMADNGIYLVPTMSFFDRGVFLDEELLSNVPTYMASKYRQKHEKLSKSREALVRHIENDTLLVGYGTDLGAVEPMHSAYREYETMIRSGVSPFKALKVATSNSAKIVGREDLGIIGPGKTADIVAWDKDPVEEKEALRHCHFVMKHGKIIRHGDRIFNASVK